MGLEPMEFNLDQNDPNITADNGTVAVMSDIYVYKVPRATVIELRPEDILSAYLKDAGAEAIVTDAFELVLRDPNKLSKKVLASGQYQIIKTFDDQTKTKKLGASKLIKSDFEIALRVKATTVLVVSTCYFQLTCRRWAETV